MRAMHIRCIFLQKALAIYANALYNDAYQGTDFDIYSLEGAS